MLGLQDASISSSFVRDNTVNIDAIREAAQDDPSWAVFSELDTKIRDGSFESAKKEARKQFAQLPIFHGTPYVSYDCNVNMLTDYMRP